MWCANKFNIQQLYALPTLYLCVLYLSEKKQRLVSHLKLIGFYKRGEKCLQRGLDWVFKYSGLRFVFKELNKCCMWEYRMDLFGSEKVQPEGYCAQWISGLKKAANLYR